MLAESDVPHTNLLTEDMLTNLSKNRALCTNNPSKQTVAFSMPKQLAAHDEQNSIRHSSNAFGNSATCSTYYIKVCCHGMTYMPETTPTISSEVSSFCLKEHRTPLYVKGGEQGLPVHPSNTPVGSLEIASFKPSRHASAKRNSASDGR